MTMREKLVEKHLVNECRQRGWRAFKFVSPGQRDVPDRLVAVKGKPGRLVLVETKAPGRKLRRSQRRLHDELAAMGINVHTADTIEAVDALLVELAHG